VVHYERHSSQFKEGVLNKFSQSGLSFRKFAEQESINLSTLYRWQKQFKTSALKVSKLVRQRSGQAKRSFQLYSKYPHYRKLS
jgi:transposase